MKILVLSILVFNSFLFGLSNEVLADKYLMSAQKNIKEKNYKRAVENFEKIFALGISVPNDIYYFYAKSLKNSGDTIKAYDIFNQYIEKVGRGSKHYKDALSFIIDMEDDVVAKKRVLVDNRLKVQRNKEKKAKEKKIADSYKDWVFIEENSSTYYGMISYRKKGYYQGVLKIGVFNGEIKYIFSMKFLDTYPYDHIYLKNWQYTRVEYVNSEHISKKTILKSGKNCKNNKCISFDGDYESSISVVVDDLQDLLILQKSKFIELEYDKLFYYTQESKQYIEKHDSGFAMPGSKKLNDIIDIIIKREKIKFY